jgi:hypothetical protein
MTALSMDSEALFVTERKLRGSSPRGTERYAFCIYGFREYPYKKCKRCSRLISQIRHSADGRFYGNYGLTNDVILCGNVVAYVESFAPWREAI